jgi:hypothetical protein
MATLSGNKIKDTYQSLVKFSDNGNITTSAKQLTDGFGNNSPMYVSTTQVGIGVTPESGLNLHVYGDAKIGSNLTVIGNLVVEGSTTTVGTDTLTVKDPLIVLANNNTSTDAVDIGFYGKYTPSGTTLYSGLFREALTGKYRLFKDLQDEPTTTVNTSGTGYAQATLIAALEGNVTGNITGNVTGNLTGNVTGDLTGDVTGNVTGNLTGNVTGGTISGTTGTFSGNVDIDGTLDVDDVISVEGSAFGRIEVGGASGGYIDLKAPNSDDYDFRLITSTGGAELYSIDTLKFYTGATTDLAFSIDASQNATFENNVTIPETPTADTHAASKGYVDAAVEGQDTLAEILAIGNTTGGTDISVSSGDDITFADNSKIILGDGSDVEMYWNGGTFVIETETFLNGTSITTNVIRAGSGTHQYIDFNQATQRFYSLSNERLQVNQTGVTVSGDLTVDLNTLFVDASANSVGINLTNPSDYTADELVISVPDGSGMTLVSGTTDAAYISFQSSTGAIATNGGFIGYDHDADGLTMFAQSKVSIAILEAEVAYFTDTAFYVDKSTTIDDNLSVSDDLGVGISVPLYKLDVVSSAADTARFTSTSSTTTNVYIGNSNATANNTANLYFMPANNIAGSYIKSTAIEDFSTAANRTSDLRFGVRKDGTFNEAVIIDSSGNVGIGASSITNYGSTYKNLDVSGSNGAYLTLIGTTNTVKVDIAAETNAGYVGTKTAHPFIFRANDVERMRIDSNGDVQFNGSTVISSNTSDGSDNAVISLAGGGANSDGRGARMRLYGNEHASLAGVVDLATGNIAGADMYLTATDSMILNTGGSERMRIRSDGYIQQGIAGTSTNAYYFFDTINYGDSGIIFRDNTSTNSGYLTYNHGQDAMKFAANGSERMRIDSSGRVGIGTTSPSEKLEVSGVIKSISTGAAKLILNGDTNNSGDTGQEDAIIDFLGDGNPGIYGYRINTENWSGQTALHFQEYINGSYTSRLKIDKDGNVGINQTSPAAKLDVYGALKAQRFFSRNGSFSSTAGNWHNVVDLQQSEYENRTLICSIYTNGTHSYASATVNCAWNGGSFVLTLGNKIAGGSTDIRVSGGYLQFYTPWTSSTNFWRITIN